MVPHSYLTIVILISGIQRLSKTRQLSKFDNPFDKPRQQRSRKNNYESVNLTISFYSRMSFLE
jgi:hypothetical protein